MKLIILDRDGVINIDSALYIKSPAEWKPIEGSLEAIARLNQAGYRVVVATNQSGIGRGLFDMDTLNAMHEKMHKCLAAVVGSMRFSIARTQRMRTAPAASPSLACLNGSPKSITST